MALDKVKTRYSKKPEAKTYLNGRVTVITQTKRMSFAEIDQELADDMRESGFDPAKLKRVGFNPETCDPDSIDPDRDLLS